ncbi:MAG: hypothetical protein ND866_19665 [Pyrinomonadaceae bacterium]|nr:hypothetical protein [Pyrinomonadaceae bacterium]
MNKSLRLMSAAGLGAGLMYLFDPDRGKRRRALVRNKVRHAAKVAGDVTGKTGRDVRNHVMGVLAEAESLFRIRDVSDDVVRARVRSKLGRIVSHPSAIEVKAVDGLIILSGPILASEEHLLLESVADLHGVKNIENLLELHDQAGDIPALQGGRPRQERLGVLKTSWSPTTRLIATAAGGALALYGARRRGMFGSALGSLGVGVVMRALTNVKTSDHVREDDDCAVIDNPKPINIDAPVDQVIDYGLPPEEFADVVSHVHATRCNMFMR